MRKMERDVLNTISNGSERDGTQRTKRTREKKVKEKKNKSSHMTDFTITPLHTYNKYK